MSIGAQLILAGLLGIVGGLLLAQCIVEGWLPPSPFDAPDWLAVRWQRVRMRVEQVLQQVLHRVRRVA